MFQFFPGPALLKASSMRLPGSRCYWSITPSTVCQSIFPLGSPWLELSAFCTVPGIGVLTIVLNQD